MLQWKFILGFALIWIASIVERVNGADIICSSTSTSKKIGPAAKESCTGVYDSNSTTVLHVPSSVEIYPSKDCNKTHVGRSECPMGKWFACCNDKEFCLDKLNSSKLHPCTSNTSFVCSSKNTSAVMKTSQTVCLGVYDKKSDKILPINATVAVKKTCKEAVSSHKSKCASGRYLACCINEKNCLDKVKKSSYENCASTSQFVCSTKNSSAVMTSTKSVCVGVYVHKNDKEIPLEVSVYDAKNCKDAVASYKSECATGQYFSCCADKANCLDNVEKSNLADCESKSEFVCSSQNSTGIMTTKSPASVCIGVYSIKEDNKKPLDVIVHSAKSCKDAISSYKTQCAAGRYLACCTEKPNCLDEVEKSKIEDCASTTNFVCSSKESPKVMIKEKSVCFATFSDNNKGTSGTVTVESYASCKKAKEQLGLICAGKFFTCCETKQCLNDVKSEKSEACSPLTKFACSSNDSTKVMEKGKSICFIVFDNKLAGSSKGLISVQNYYSSCGNAKKNLKSICPNKYYICCETIHCLDSAKASDSSSCGSQKVNKDIVCIKGSSDLVLKNGKGVCLMLQRPHDMQPKSKTSKLSDCDAARKIYCFPGNWFFCCKASNCLSEAAHKFQPCNAASRNLTFLSNKFMFLFTIIALLFSVVT